MYDYISPETIKAIVNDLYTKEGMSVKDIAKNMGRSEPWVYKRLTEVSKLSRRKMVKSFEGEITDQTESTVKKLRKDGCTLKDISAYLGKSIYFVYSKLDSKYAPKGSSQERLFQTEKVIPFLESKGHIIMSEGLQIENDFAALQPDIVSIYNNELFITEVKASLKGHNLQTALGQITLDRYIFKEANNLRFQIIFPTDTQQRKFNINNNFIEFIKYLFQIDIVFI